MRLSTTVMVTGLVALGAVWFTGCGQAAGTAARRRMPMPQPVAPTVVWTEGEDFADASRLHLAEAAGEGRDAVVAIKPPASGGKAMGGPSVEFKDSFVSFEVTLPKEIKDAQLLFRYARYNWRHLDPEIPAKFRVTLKAGGATTVREALFKDTNGWGMKSEHFHWQAVKVGDLPAGTVEVTLRSVKDDNSIVMDGFLVASGTLQMGQREASDLVRVVISSEGYCGLLSPSTVYREIRPGVFVAARSFDGRQADVSWRGESVQRTRGGPLRTDEACGRRVCAQRLARREDGPCAVVIEATTPRLELKVPILLAGELAAAVPAHVAKLEAKLAEAAKGTNDQLARCVPDFRAAVDFLTSGLEAVPSSQEPEIVVADLKMTIGQGEETLRRLEAGQDPYAGRTGQLRRGFISAATGELVPYRMMIPPAYPTQDKVPLVLMLGGSGASENEMFGHDDGFIPKMLAERGYMQITPPTYQRDRQLNVKDYLQLIELVLKEYPKLDRSRVYATGVSSGGFHSFALAVAWPDVFAGIACVSGTTGRPEAPEVANLKRVPTLIIHGGSDTVVPQIVAENTAKRLEELGAVYEFKLFPTYGHDYRSSEYLPLTLAWWAAHPKPPAPAE